MKYIACRCSLRGGGALFQSDWIPQMKPNRCSEPGVSIAVAIGASRGPGR